MASPPGGGDQGSFRELILDVGALLLNNFIYERVRRHGGTDVTRQQLGGGELTDPNLKEIADCLQKIGDTLDGNSDLQRLINSPTLEPSKEVFLEVAVAIFADGNFNWGRVVTLFYFAYRLVIKALLKNIPDIIRTIINWTLEYLQEHVINWIREQGGWEGIRSYVSTPKWQTLAVFLAGVLTAVVVINKT